LNPKTSERLTGIAAIEALLNEFCVKRAPHITENHGLGGYFHLVPSERRSKLQAVAGRIVGFFARFGVLRQIQRLEFYGANEQRQTLMMEAEFEFQGNHVQTFTREIDATLWK
jgi:hypothetical protein